MSPILSLRQSQALHQPRSPPAPAPRPAYPSRACVPEAKASVSTSAKRCHRPTRPPPSRCEDTSVGTSLSRWSAWPRPTGSTKRFTPAPGEEGAALRHRGRVAESGSDGGDLGAGEALRVHACGHQPAILVIETESAELSFAKRPHHAILRQNQRVTEPAGSHAHEHDGRAPERLRPKPRRQQD